MFGETHGPCRDYEPRDTLRRDNVKCVLERHRIARRYNCIFLPRHLATKARYSDDEERNLTEQS